MAFQTPVKRLPGAFVNTPAPMGRRLWDTVSNGRESLVHSSDNGTMVEANQQTSSNQLPLRKAADAVDSVIQQDAAYPDLDQYCRPGASSDCSLSRSESSWVPFASVISYPIPDSIFEHINGADLSTLMGLFAEINHAWVAIDNALYLWDYTRPDPELIGFEEQPNAIQAVALVPPKAGVFVKEITHILVVATTHDILLLGVAVSTDSSGSKQVSLYQTKMSLHNRGSSDINIIRASANGRIFYGGFSDTDVNELYYQQEEKWFSSRCGRINHSNLGWTTVMPNVRLMWNQPHEHLIDIAIDDSRRLLYTLSSDSTIRTYHIDGPDRLTKLIERTKKDCWINIDHMMDRSPLLADDVQFVAISPITATEAARLHLMVLTNTGCRLFLSATGSSSYFPSQSATPSAPQTMQVQYVKFPPSNASRRSSSSPQSREDGQVDMQSTLLTQSRRGVRYAPGYFLDLVQRDNDVDLLFVSGPDTGRIKADVSSPANLKYHERGCWIELGSRAEDIGLASKPFMARSDPEGFGNELAVQFDAEPSQFAILTNTGVHMVQRRRMVDMFASALRVAVGPDGLDKDVRRFISTYGRVETIFCALAVACGHGINANRVGRAADNLVEDRGRSVFIEYGGQPVMKDIDGGTLSAESVKLSSRHDALCLYLGRLIRSTWGEKVIQMTSDKAGALDIISRISLDKLARVQEEIERLRGFLWANRGLIQGLSGPGALQRTKNRGEEFALQSEHQALVSVQQLLESISEGISFVLVLFDERVVDIFLRLDDSDKQQLQNLTYRTLYSLPEGRELAKRLVKAIVNRNIENGSNVETVAESLRRRCGSFCSSQDVVIFKAQEQLKKASEETPNTTAARHMLAESLRLFVNVAGSLGHAHLAAAVKQFVELDYYAGAISLCLRVAHERDRGNAALAWHHEGKPANDPRANLMEEREKCYRLIYEVMTVLDEAVTKQPEQIDGKLTLIGMKSREAYEVVNDSNDEVFHYNLYDWYIQKGWSDRILTIDSPHVVTYLERLAVVDLKHGELLCKFYTLRNEFLEAADVQRALARSDLNIDLKDRINLLSKAKAYAGVVSPGIPRQKQQTILHEITELLDVAHIQYDLLKRLLQERRLTDERKEAIERQLNNKVLDLNTLYNEFADQANYYDLCLLIISTSHFRNPSTILTTWENLIMQLHLDLTEKQQLFQEGRITVEPGRPYEVIADKVIEIAHRTSLDSFVFPVADLVPMLCRYAVECAQDSTIGANPCWPVEVFQHLRVSHDMIVRALEGLLDANEAPFRGRQSPAKVRLIEWIVVAVHEWLDELGRRGGGVVAAAHQDSGAIGPWVQNLLARCDEELPQTGPNPGSLTSVPELKRLLVEARRTVDSMVGVNLTDQTKFL